MMVEFDEQKWAKAIVKNLITKEDIDEQDIHDEAYEILDIWAIENLGLLQILVETTIEEFKKQNIEVQQ